MAKNVKNGPLKAKDKATAIVVAGSLGKAAGNDQFIRDETSLIAAIEDHIKKGADWQRMTQRLLISAALYCVRTNTKGDIIGQITPIINLVNGTATMTHGDSIAKWVQIYAPIVIKEGKPHFSMVRAKKFLENGIQEYEKHLLASKFYVDLTPPPVPFKGFDDMAKLAALVKQMNKMLDAKHNGILEVKGEEVELSQAQRDLIEVDEDLLAELTALTKRGARKGSKAKVIDAEATVLN